MQPKNIWISIVVFTFFIIIPTVLWMRDYNFSFQGRIDSPILSNYFSAISVIISSSSLVISFVLLNVAIKAAKNFDVKKQFHNKQFELVCLLSQEIMATKLSFIYYQKLDKPIDDDYSKECYVLNFYSLRNYISERKIDGVYTDEPIEKILPFLRHRYNPLLPKIISDGLFNLEQNRMQNPLIIDPPDDLMADIDFNSYFVDKPDNYLLLSSYNEKEPFYKDYLSSLYKSNAHIFEKEVGRIREIILKWFLAYGADDINV